MTIFVEVNCWWPTPLTDVRGKTLDITKSHLYLAFWKVRIRWSNLGFLGQNRSCRVLILAYWKRQRRLGRYMWENLTGDQVTYYFSKANPSLIVWFRCRTTVASIPTSRLHSRDSDYPRLQLETLCILSPTQSALVQSRRGSPMDSRRQTSYNHIIFCNQIGSIRRSHYTKWRNYQDPIKSKEKITEYISGNEALTGTRSHEEIRVLP